MKAALLGLLTFCVLGMTCSTTFAGERWSAERANDWYTQRPWLVGCNFGPSNAINQLEMWQADTFDLAAIDRELGWAEQLGFNSVRVFLHDLLWQQDPKGFLSRMDKFLETADKHHIGVMFVLMDSVWDPHPRLGPQRAPRPHLHNSGWLQSPGVEIMRDRNRHDEMEGYVKGVISRFRTDPRVHAWDLINEPDNTNRSSYSYYEPANKEELSLALLQKAFDWAREMDPQQPLTSGVWVGNWPDPDKLRPIEQCQLDESDIITFHSYDPPEGIKKCVDNLRRYNRPILCTEYMARPRGSTFEAIMPYLKQEKVAAYNWGFVAGKTQTIYPWDSWTQNYTAEPQLWFHDIFRADGQPYKPAEVEFIRRTTGRPAK